MAALLHELEDLRPSLLLIQVHVNCAARRATLIGAHSIDRARTVVDGTVYVGSNNHRLYALDASTGFERRTYTTGGAVRSSPAVVDGTVYVGSNDGIGKNDATLFALDAVTGAVPAS
ncbi:PQQ-binding-like beta-propeller repeat protein [Streptomyces sp. NPDC059837]|uniref:outer membrane protein assembly factor BamB family protein n=1 Tax=Streptomyces sp. NPDC059837 TaxID=3346968 RepID=UPI0036630CAB